MGGCSYLDVQGVFIRGGIDCDSLKTEFLACSDDPDGDLASVGNENFRDGVTRLGVSSPRRGLVIAAEPAGAAESRDHMLPSRSPWSSANAARRSVRERGLRDHRLPRCSLRPMHLRRHGGLRACSPRSSGCHSAHHSLPNRAATAATRIRRSQAKLREQQCQDQIKRRDDALSPEYIEEGIYSHSHEEKPKRKRPPACLVLPSPSFTRTHYLSLTHTHTQCICLSPLCSTRRKEGKGSMPAFGFTARCCYASPRLLPGDLATSGTARLFSSLAVSVSCLSLHFPSLQHFLLIIAIIVIQKLLSPTAR